MSRSTNRPACVPGYILRRSREHDKTAGQSHLTVELVRKRILAHGDAESTESMALAHGLGIK